MTAVTAARRAQQAYGRSSAPVRTHRGTEYAVFMRVTQQLKASAQQGREAFPALAAAIHENRRLWAALAADVAGPANGLSPDLRARLFYLSEFTYQHSAKVLAGKASVGALIEINAAVMRGLAGQGAGTDAASGPTDVQGGAS
jgi:flagellar protein FlaF